MRKEGTLWSLTPQLLEIGFCALANTGVNEFYPVSLQELARRCNGDRVNIGEKGRDEVIIIARASSDEERRKIVVVNLRVGSSLPQGSALFGAGPAGRPVGDRAVSRSQGDDRGYSIVQLAARSLSLGLSVNDDDDPMARIER